MTESTGFPDPDQVFPPAPVAPEVAQAAAAEQIAAQAAGVSADAGPNLEQIRADAQREVLLPMEGKIDALMAQLDERSKAQDAQIAALRAQLASAQASVGPPEVVNLGQAVADRLASAAAASPSGLPKAHFAPVLAHAADLAAAASEAVQSGDGAKAVSLAGKIEHWVTVTHRRSSGAVVEHFPALLDDLERLAEAAAKLAPAAAAAAPAAS
jgi:hypothetical protein